VYSWSRWTINLNSSTCTADHAEQLISTEINCSAWSAVHVDELKLIVQRDQLYTWTHPRVQLITLNNQSQLTHVYSWSRWTINLNSSTCTVDHAEQLISTHQLYTWVSWDWLFSVISCTRGWVEIYCSAWSAVHVDELKLIVQRDSTHPRVRLITLNN
jgi:hypothetical protein